MAERSGDVRSLQFAQLGLAELDLPAGRAGVARERLVALLDRGGLDETSVGGMLALLAQANLDLDDVDMAEEIAAQAIAFQEKNETTR